MWSVYSLEVMDSVARTGSFTSSAAELHRVPSAISYTIKQLEQWLAVELFERRHRDVVLTEAGHYFLNEARIIIKNMETTRRRCQQIANGWRGSFHIAIDLIVKPQRIRQLVLDFYKNFPDIELIITKEVFNGVWDALADNRADIAIGATSAVPVGGSFAFRDMGLMPWCCVVQTGHPATQLTSPVAHNDLRIWPSLVLEDTSRYLPKRTTWTLDNQKRLTVPDWASGIDCLQAGLCVGMVPAHLVMPLIERKELTQLFLDPIFPDSNCWVSWKESNSSPVINWLLDYLGDSETLNKEWLSAH